jgi:hypothetical protein
MNDDPFQDWDAAYVLGMLAADDRRAFEQHLTRCAACSAAVAELAGMPGILATLSPAEAVSLSGDPEHDRDPDGDPDLVTRLAVAARRHRRRNRLATAGAGIAAAAVLLGGGIVIGSAGDPVTPPAHLVAMAEVQAGIMTADLSVEKKAWGTRFDWNCQYVATPWKRGAQRYELVVIDAAGTQTTVASWTASGPRATALSASSSVPMSSIRRVEIRVAGSARPLTVTEL